MVVSVFDENGEMVPNKVRVTWGRMENFKCVDYFQVIIDYISKLGILRITYFYTVLQTVSSIPVYCN